MSRFPDSVPDGKKCEIRNWFGILTWISTHKRPNDFCFLETLGGPKCNEDVEEGLGVKFSCIICRPEARI